MFNSISRRYDRCVRRFPTPASALSVVSVRRCLYALPAPSRRIRSCCARSIECLALNDGPVLAYDDPRRAIGKRVRIENGRITAIRLAGETLARHWLQSLWLEGRADEQLRRWLLAPLSAPPGQCSAPTVGNKTLCNCKNVSQARSVPASVEAWTCRA